MVNGAAQRIKRFGFIRFSTFFNIAEQIARQLRHKQEPSPQDGWTDIWFDVPSPELFPCTGGLRRPRADVP